jgi:hypothetical protein
MRRNVIAALALMLWGAGLTAAAVAQVEYLRVFTQPRPNSDIGSDNFLRQSVCHFSHTDQSRPAMV